MSRKNRQLSSTDIYHAIWRGVAKQNIFIENNDYKKFLDILTEFKFKYNFEIYAYCLMSNHIHLLIKSNEISILMKSIGGKYAQWFNLKYERKGHLFQDRFLSEAIEDEKYLVTVLRYIHQNPVAAGIVNKIEDYKWSSYEGFIKKNSFVDYKLPVEIIGNDNFIVFNNTYSNDKVMDVKEMPKRITDEKATELIMKYGKCSSIYDFQGLNDENMASVIKKLLKNNLSIGQLERLTGTKRYKIKMLIK